MNEDVKKSSVHIHSRADELIACLEGEIAKRDAELAACRVAVENCEVFRARIAELEADRDRIKTIADNYSALNMDSQAELSAIKAQEPVAWRVTGTNAKHRHPHIAIEFTEVLAEGQAAHWRNRGCTTEVTALYAAPVSEAKAQGVVLQELRSFEKWWCSTPILRESKRTIAEKAWRAARIAAAPAAPVSGCGDC